MSNNLFPGEIPNQILMYTCHPHFETLPRIGNDERAFHDFSRKLANTAKLSNETFQIQREN